MSFQTYFNNLITKINNNFLHLKTQIDNISGATVDQIFDGTSQNAQSGIAISEAGFQANVLEGVQINGTALSISSKKVNIPVAGASTLGVGMANTAYGIYNYSNFLAISKASDDQISAKTNNFRPIVPSNLDLAVKTGIVSNSITLTSAEKTAVKTWLGIDDVTENTVLSWGFIQNSVLLNYYTKLEQDDIYTQFANAFSDKDLSNLSSTGETHINDSVIEILKLIYPVGGIFIGTTSTCPMAQFFGTWELVAADRVLQGSSSNHAANSTINASLPTLTAASNGDHAHNKGTMDIVGWFTGGRSGTTGVSGCFVSKTEGSDAYASGNADMYKVNFKGSSGWTGNTNTTGAHTHSVTWTNHVGTTVQSDAYVVNVWRRTA